MKKLYKDNFITCYIIFVLFLIIGLVDIIIGYNAEYKYDTINHYIFGVGLIIIAVNIGLFGGFNHLKYIEKSKN